MKLFGINFSNNTIKKVQLQSDTTGKKRTPLSSAIKKQFNRNVSFEIKDIKLAEELALNSETPDRTKLFKIYNYILKDAHLSSQIRTALIKVQSEPWLLYKNGKEDLQTSTNFRRKFFSKIIELIVKKEWFGFSLIELDQLDPQNNNIATVLEIDRECININKQHILLEGTNNGKYIPYAAIIKEANLLQIGDANGLGCLLECAYNIIWKYYSRNDWSRMNEKVGMPIITVVADTNNDAELDAIEERAANFGTDGYMIGQKGDEFGILERGSDNAHATFKDMISICNDEVSKIINGTTSVTDVKAFVGSAEVGERTMDDFTKARLQNIVDEMKETVIPFLISKGFKLDGYDFDYPCLVAERSQKINRLTIDTTNKKEEATTPTPNYKNKK